MLRAGVEAVVKFDANEPRCRSPATHPWYVLIELSSQAQSGLREAMEEILAHRPRAGSGA